MRARVSEKRLVDVLRNFLSDTHCTAREVRHYEKRIDIVAICPESGELWAIEAKTRDWRRAVEQAIVNLAAAERSYIAVQEEFAHRVSLEELADHGIGLIAVGSKWGRVQVLKEAGRSPFLNLLANQRIKMGVMRERMT
jgi:hypothetical protein